MGVVGTLPVTFKVTNQEGCESEPDTATISIAETPEISVLVNEKAVDSVNQVTVFHELPTSIQIDAGGADISWTVVQIEGEASGFSETGSDLQFRPTFVLPDELDSASITYEVIASNGECSTNFTFKLKIVRPFFIPNFVSPNGDDQNDTWAIKINNVELFDQGINIKIFNRTGAKVYESQQQVSTPGLLTEPWNGGDCPDGAYWYIINNEGQSPAINLTGSITLLRGNQ